MVPHGMAVSLTAPEAFRFTFDAAPERHLHAARLLDPDVRPRRPGRPAGRAHRADARHRHPQRARRVGYGEADVDDLVDGALKQQRLLATAPRRPTETTSRGLPRLDGTVVTCRRRPDLVAELRRRGVADVDDSTLTRALYSSDASLYRVVPQVVVRPRHADELVAILDAAAATGAPVTMRGAGTSIAGNAVGTGIVVDTAQAPQPGRSIDPEARTAVVAARRRARRPAARGRAGTGCASARTRRPTPAARSAG